MHNLFKQGKSPAAKLQNIFGSYKKGMVKKCNEILSNVSIYLTYLHKILNVL